MNETDKKLGLWEDADHFVACRPEQVNGLISDFKAILAQNDQQNGRLQALLFLNECQTFHQTFQDQIASIVCNMPSSTEDPIDFWIALKQGGAITLASNDGEDRYLDYLYVQEYKIEHRVATMLMVDRLRDWRQEFGPGESRWFNQCIPSGKRYEWKLEDYPSLMTACFTPEQQALLNQHELDTQTPSLTRSSPRRSL